MSDSLQTVQNIDGEQFDRYSPPAMMLESNTGEYRQLMQLTCFETSVNGVLTTVNQTFCTSDDGHDSLDEILPVIEDFLRRAGFEMGNSSIQLVKDENNE